jgi:very-short-patch-repair endonuclease
MDVVGQVRELGGATNRSTIVALCGKDAVDLALDERLLLRDARGRYSLPDAHRGVRVANSIGGVLSHRSAAAYWGWEQKKERELPEVTVPRNKRVGRERRKVLIPHWSALSDADVAPGVNCVTSKRRTLVDCFRNLPYDEALAIADSAVRTGDFTHEEMAEIAESTKGCGRRRIICVAEDASEKAANALESVVRAIGNLVPGLETTPQMPIEVGEELILHPDLGDPEIKSLIEAEGFGTHGTREGHDSDCVRYNIITLHGWLLVRFTWYQVMEDPTYVFTTLLGLVRVGRLNKPGHADVALVA